VGFSGDRTVVPALAAAASDPDPDVVAAAERAMERIEQSGVAGTAP
jgi:hypothetical protein